MKETLDFLRKLRENNNREWFNENKAEYEKVREHFVSKVDELLRATTAFDEELVGLDAKNTLFRIYRDVRFSPDKSPYKTYFSAYFAKGGRKSIRAGYYLHLEPDNCLLAGGVWCPESKLLKSLRQAVYDHSDEFLGIIKAPEFIKSYPQLEGDMLKTVPAPFPKDTPLGELVRHKDYTVTSHKKESFFDSSDWVSKAAGEFKKLEPFNRFLNYTVDEFLED